jgi:hypothetical protein
LEHKTEFGAQVLIIATRTADRPPILVERYVEEVIATVVVLACLNLHLALNARLVVKSILFLLALS